MTEKLCSGCRHLRMREDPPECGELVHRVICGECLKVYDVTDIRCPSCQIVSTNEAGILRRVESGPERSAAIRSAYCPLSAKELEKLERLQALPAEAQKQQKSLF